MYKGTLHVGRVVSVRRPPALLCYLLAFVQIFWVVGCEDSIRGGGSQQSTTLAGILANTRPMPSPPLSRKSLSTTL